MAIEKSAGAIIFRKENNENYYLFLNYSAIGNAKKTYWGFPKGGIEKGESELEAAKREIKEETGLDKINFIEGFKEREKYFFKFKEKNILKFVTFYLAETETQEIHLSSEHNGYIWLTYEKGIKQLSFKNAKEILKKANDFLNSKFKN